MATTYFMSPTGVAGPGSLGSPWGNFAQAQGVAVAGDTVLLRGGVYNIYFDDLNFAGTSWAATVRFANYPGETVWLVPTSGLYALYFDTIRRYFDFDGINVDARGNVNGAPIRIEGWAGGNAHHIRIQNATIIAGGDGVTYQSTNGGAMGVLVTAGVPGLIGGNQFLNLHLSGGGDVGDFAYAFYIQSDDNLVQGCEITDTAGAGIQIYNGHGPTPTNNVIQFNYIHDITRSADVRVWGIIDAASSGTKIYANLITGIGGTTGAGIYVYTGSGAIITHNTVYGGATLGIYLDTGASGAVLRNNICYQNAGGNFYDGGSGTDGDGTTNFFSGDPGFVNAAGGDFRLTTSSAAYWAGAYAAAVPTDIAGTPYHNPPSMGCYEVVSGAPSYTGTGSYARPVPTVAASGLFLAKRTGTGAFAIAKPSPAGTGAVINHVVGAGTVVFAKPTVTGTGAVINPVTGTGTIARPVAALAGSAGIVGVGAVALSAPLLAATSAITGSGALALGALAWTAAGPITGASAGTVTLTGPAVAGTGTFLARITGTGAVAITGPAVAATGTFLARLTGTGDLTRAVTAIAATGLTITPITGTGDIARVVAALLGAGPIAGSGAVAIGAPAVTGESPIDGTGAVTIGPVAFDGVDLFFTGTAAFVRPVVALDGTGTSIDRITGTGDVTRPVTAFAGSAALIPVLTGSGAVVVGGPAIDGHSLAFAPANSALVAALAVLAAAGLPVVLPGYRLLLTDLALYTTLATTRGFGSPVILGLSPDEAATLSGAAINSDMSAEAQAVRPQVLVPPQSLQVLGVPITTSQAGGTITVDYLGASQVTWSWRCDVEYVADAVPDADLEATLTPDVARLFSDETTVSAGPLTYDAIEGQGTPILVPPQWAVDRADVKLRREERA